jgi:hypothetical protein
MSALTWASAVGFPGSASATSWRPEGVTNLAEDQS